MGLLQRCHRPLEAEVMRAERNTSAEHVNVQIHERVRTLLKTQYNGRSHRRLIKYKGTVRNARRTKENNIILNLINTQ